jgi:hypothetical protein
VVTDRHAEDVGSKIPQFRRQRECQQEVTTGQQAGRLFLESGPGLVLLAGRTMPIAALIETAETIRQRGKRAA